MDIKRISPEEAQELLSGDQAWTYLDVRTEEEFDEGHVPGAVNIPIAVRTPRGMQPNPEFLEEVQAALATDSSIITGCLRGGRSLRAAGVLIGAGYSHILDMRGGWDGEMDGMGAIVYPGWQRRGLPIEMD